jgi:hypothetical protein
VLRSDDQGATWRSIAGDLPKRGTVYALEEDPVDRDLLFAGTEFGLFFTKDGGGHWIQLKGGLPTIEIRDIAIQKRENDLVVATFGRGFYILDDYSPLRTARAADLGQEAVLFPVKPARVVMPKAPLGVPGKAFQGDAFFTAPNPPFGVVFTYYLKDEIKTKKKTRHEREKEADKKGGEMPYATLADLRAESAEEDPAVILTVSDSEGNVVRRLTTSGDAGIHRIAWDLRYPPAVPTSLKPFTPNPFSLAPIGPMVTPGHYTVSMARRVDGVDPFASPRASMPRGSARSPPRTAHRSSPSSEKPRGSSGPCAAPAKSSTRLATGWLTSSSRCSTRPGRRMPHCPTRPARSKHGCATSTSLSGAIRSRRNGSSRPRRRSPTVSRESWPPNGR